MRISTKKKQKKIAHKNNNGPRPRLSVSMAENEETTFVPKPSAGNAWDGPFGCDGGPPAEAAELVVDRSLGNHLILELWAPTCALAIGGYVALLTIFGFFGSGDPNHNPFASPIHLAAAAAASAASGDNGGGGGGGSAVYDDVRPHQLLSVVVCAFFLASGCRNATSLFFIHQAQRPVV